MSRSTEFSKGIRGPAAGGLRLHDPLEAVRLLALYYKLLGVRLLAVISWPIEWGRFTRNG